jgi:hypothetical protein
MYRISAAALCHLRPNLEEVRGAVSALEELLEARKQDQACREIKYELAAARFEAGLISFAQVCRKAGFKQDQPRWPIDTPGEPKPGGRWSGGAGSAAPSSEPSANPKSSGHHFVPGEIYRNEPLKPETRKVFEGAKTGPIPGGSHVFDKEHREYNRAVTEAFERFKGNNGIARSEDVTPEQAKKFIDEIRGSYDPRIRSLNMKIFMRQFRFYMRRGVRGGIE